MCHKHNILFSKYTIVFHNPENEYQFIYGKTSHNVNHYCVKTNRYEMDGIRLKMWKLFTLKIDWFLRNLILMYYIFYPIFSYILFGLRSIRNENITGFTNKSKHPKLLISHFLN